MKHSNNTTLKNPNHKKRFHNALNGPKSFFPGGAAPETPGGLSMSASAWAHRPKPSLHGLSLNKSPIKKPYNIIRVGSSNRIKQN